METEIYFESNFTKVKNYLLSHCSDNNRCQLLKALSPTTFNKLQMAMNKAYEELEDKTLAIISSDNPELEDFWVEYMEEGLGFPAPDQPYYFLHDFLGLGDSIEQDQQTNSNKEPFYPIDFDIPNKNVLGSCLPNNPYAKYTLEQRETCLKVHIPDREALYQVTKDLTGKINLILKHSFRNLQGCPEGEETFDIKNAIQLLQDLMGYDIP